MKYEQIVNKIIFILFYRTYIEARYIALRYIIAIWNIASVNHFYFIYLRSFRCKVFLLYTLSYNLTCKNTEYPSYSNIPLTRGVFYIIKHLFDCETRAMCSTHTSHSKIQLKISLTPYIINCIKFSHNSL